MSKAKKPKQAAQSLYNSLDMSGLTRAQRANILCAAYIEYPATVAHHLRIADLSLRSGLSKNALNMLSQRRRWKEALGSTEGNANTLGDQVPSVLQVEVVQKTFSAIQMAAGIKAYAAISTETCTAYTRTTQKLVNIWCARIDHCISRLADPMNLTGMEARELQLLHSELSDFLNSAARFISPAALTSLLQSVNFSATVPQDLPDDLDREAFTLRGLQVSLSKMGVRSILDDSTAAEDVFSAYADQMPSIEATR